MVYNATQGKRERLGRLLHMHANKRETSTRSKPAISPRLSVSGSRSRATRSAKRDDRFFSKRWISPSL